VQGDALQLPTAAADYAAAKAAYLARFAQSAQMFELADFSLFIIRAVSVRFVAGYGKAFSLSPEAYARALDSD